jgi:hypothetical protein
MLQMGVAAGATAQAELPWPLKGAGELKQLHGLTWTGMQLLTYRHSTDYNEPVSARTIIGLGRDAIFREEDGHRVVVDFRLGRIYEMEANGRFQNSPIAAGIAERVHQRSIRPLSRRVESRFAPVDGKEDRRPVMENLWAPMSDPFWTASETHVTHPSDAEAVWETRKIGPVTEFLRDGHTAVRWQPKDKALPKEVAAQLPRAFTWLWAGHPAILKTLSQGQQPPALLAIGLPKMRGFAVETFELESMEWCATCELMPPTAQPTVLGNTVFARELWPIMVAAVGGGYTQVTEKIYLERIESALEQDRVLEAWLWTAESSFQYKIPTSPSNPEVPLEDDPRGVVLRKAKEIEEIREIQQKNGQMLETLLRLRERVPTNAYMLEFFWVVNSIDKKNVLFDGLRTGQPPQQALEFLTRSLQAMPLVPLVYSDMGILYQNAARPKEAWLAWELGQGLPVRNVFPHIWDKPKSLKEAARTEHPEFY